MISSKENNIIYYEKPGAKGQYEGFKLIKVY